MAESSDPPRSSSRRGLGCSSGSRSRVASAASGTQRPARSTGRTRAERGGLPTSPHSRALQTARTHDVPPEPRLFAKTGLLIRADSRFSLLVPPQGATLDRLGERTGAATQGGGCPRMREAVGDPLWLARLPWRVLGSSGGLLLANRQLQRSRTAPAARAGRSMLGPEATRRPDRALSPNATPGSARAAGHGHESTPRQPGSQTPASRATQTSRPHRHLPCSARLAGRCASTGRRTWEPCSVMKACLWRQSDVRPAARAEGVF